MDTGVRRTGESTGTEVSGVAEATGSQEPTGAEIAADRKQDNLIAAYKAACNRHQQIDEFRGKLLALLPIVSGAIGLVLISKQSTFQKYLTPIGVYGFVATLGLFIYELYGICVCKQIMEQAGGLEDELDVPPSMAQFRDRKQDTPRRRLIQAEMASWTIYLSVLTGWLYVAGAHKWWDRESPWWIGGIALILLVRGTAIAFPSWWDKLRFWRTPPPQSPGGIDTDTSNHQQVQQQSAATAANRANRA